MTDCAPIGPRQEVNPVLLVVATMSADSALARTAAEAFAEPWGGLDLTGTGVPFDQTRYYEPEMGPGLVRTYCTGVLVRPECLAEFKRGAWAIECRYRRGEQRQVNLDPGYLDHNKVVLASFKHGPQKLYLGQAVWADMVLFFRDGAFRPLPWTFPDLRAGSHLEFFATARQRYKTLLGNHLKSARSEVDCRANKEHAKLGPLNIIRGPGTED